MWQEIYEPGGVGKIWGFDNRWVPLKGRPRLSLAAPLPVLQESGPSEVSDKDDEERLSSA